MAKKGFVVFIALLLWGSFTTLLSSLFLVVWVDEIVFAAKVQPDKARIRITGEVSEGKVFMQAFGPGVTRRPTEEEIDRVGNFGQGELRVLDYRLGDLATGQQARFEWMAFEVDLSWPAAFKP